MDDDDDDDEERDSVSSLAYDQRHINPGIIPQAPSSDASSLSTKGSAIAASYSSGQEQQKVITSSLDDLD
eukprot:CAMPEP_0118695094 /NCGR_PEP_ID=MMETSP0800-20121206/12966_1 /TAXON_ID=210618 ORGANISM="Striatella unipunctata, Strain CCMP2910" /NCGR_SAMPLE_ID=MMETSP0800 /ASSEMBLY_ACC=CAM_ASM_000638 /LENGTH=69 /DNA_ID=CAMNT_0006593789 /DNA_START=264 /DNA_END=473 /DNA_ORIENTATION=-